MQDQETQSTVEVPSHGGEAGVMAISPMMMGLTWVTFILVTVILYKIAWKPILATLERREETIRKAQENAERIREQLLEMEEKRKAAMAEADNQAKDIIAAARRAAEEAGRVIEERSRKEAQILIENAARDIGKARDSAVATLRKESADLSIKLAGRLIGANLDDEKNRSMVDKLIGQVSP
jgi:F-type H+-transporting ATPase subunit b